MYEAAKPVADNPSLIAEFDMDPEAAAKKIHAFLGPPSSHMHIPDGENSYRPPEDVALSQIGGHHEQDDEQVPRKCASGRSDWCSITRVSMPHDGQRSRR